MNFPSHMFFNDINHGHRAAILKKIFLWLLPFYAAVATHFYYEKVRRTMRTPLVSYLLKEEEISRRRGSLPNRVSPPPLELRL